MPAARYVCFLYLEAMQQSTQNFFKSVLTMLLWDVMLTCDLSNILVTSRYETSHVADSGIGYCYCHVEATRTASA